MTPKQIIERIRSDNFWIGRDIPQDLRKGSEFQRRNTTNACKRLSEELYDKESHFVLELIQNADDNQYAEGAQPSLSFKIEGNRIVVANNEIGFTKENVEALCQIGESTKVKANIKGDSYIGEKGIGFKSIFRVSSHPQIHSAGFHFSFKVDSDTSEPNYICPRWIEDPRQHINSPGTTLVLPANSGVVFREDAYFKHIGSEILLFLRRLQALRVQSESGQRGYAKKQLKDGVSELSLSFTGKGGSTTSTRRHFMVVDHTVDVKGLGGERRKNFVSSKLHLAFGLEQSADTWTAAADPRSNLFAFLPVRAYGFRFIVQGDFLLTSSRGSVDFALPWNAALAQSIPNAFISAVERFKTIPSLRTAYFEYLPRPNEITEEGLEPLGEAIYSRLGATACILTESGTWRKPTDILLANDEDRALIPNSDLLLLLGKEYPSKEMAAPKPVLQKLGCDEFSLPHLLACLEHKDWVSAREDSWFAELYRIIGSAEPDDDDLKALRKLSILRLADGKTTTYRDQTFLPLSLSQQYGFESELQMLSAASSGTSDREDEPIREFLYSLGVSEPSTEMIIDRVIVPGCDSPFGEEGSASRSHLGHIRYLRDHWKQYLESKQKNKEAARRSIASKLRLLGSPLGEPKTVHALPPDQLYLGEAYDNDCPLESLFGKGGIFTLSDSYINQSDEGELKSWWSFFQDLGVAVVPRVEDSGDYAPSAEVKKVIASPLSERRIALLAVITKHWDRRYKFRAILPTAHGPKRSAFFEALAAMPVPVRGGGQASMQETFIYKDDIYAAFKDTVKYIDLPDSAVAEDVLKAAGVRTSVDFQAALLALKNAKKDDKADTKRLATLYQLIAVYASAHQEQLRDEFETWDLLFNPADGTWRSPSQCFWESRYDVLDRRCGALAQHYGGTKDFFCELLGVPEIPTLVQLHSLLHSISQSKLAKADATLVKQIYLEIADRIEELSPADYRWKEVIKSLSGGLILARDGRFHAANQVLFDDNPELATMFASHPKVAIMESDYHNLHELQPLLEACSIKSVSQAIVPQLPPTTSQHRSPELTSLLHNRWPELMRYLRHEGDRSDYKRLKSDPSLPKRLEVRLVEALRAKYELAGVQVERPERSAHQGDAILLDKTANNDFDRLSLETCRTLGLDQKEANFFYMIFSRPIGENLGVFFDNRAIPPLPDDELPAVIPTDDLVNAEEAQQPPIEDDGSQVIDTTANLVAEPRLKEDVSDPDTEDFPTTQRPPSDAATPADNTDTFSTPPPNNPVQWPGSLTHGESKDPADERTALPQPETGSAAKEDISRSAEGSSLQAPEDESWPTGQSHPSTASPGRPRPPLTGKSLDGQRAGPQPPTSSGHKRGPSEHSRSGPFQQIYIAASVSGSETPREENPEAVRLGDLGEDWVVELEQRAGWKAKRMPRNNKGYDITSQLGDELRFIEVKTVGGEWSRLGVSVTHAQFNLALEMGDKYWLYVVENVEDPSSRRCTRIQDPARKVTRFLFDESWRQLVAQETPDDSWIDCQVDLGDGRSARVLRVRGGGQLRLLDVLIEDGEQKQVPFDPQKMRKL